MDVELRRIMPGNTADEVVDVIYNNDADVLNAVDKLKGQLYGEEETTTEGGNKEVIPYNSQGNYGTFVDNYLSYEVQDAIQGQYIYAIRAKFSQAGVFTVKFSTARTANSAVWTKQFSVPVSGEQELIINRILPAGQYIGFHDPSDTAKFYVIMGTRNPVGGGAYANIGNQAMDLCVGITIIPGAGSFVPLPEEAGDIPRLWQEMENLKNGGEPVKSIDYIALGDSITIGFGGFTPYPARLGEHSSITLIHNFAVSGMGVTGSSGFITQINKVPDNFGGLITMMIGINNNNSTMGDAAAVLAKNYNSLDINSTFAEAFRYCLETLLRKAPVAKILVILPLKTGDREAGAIQIRQIERDICEYFAVPYTGIYLTCGISPLTFSTLMPDKLHPNNEGNAKIEKALWPVVRDLIS